MSTKCPEENQERMVGTVYPGGDLDEAVSNALTEEWMSK